jgi:heat shock protein HslJ
MRQAFVLVLSTLAFVVPAMGQSPNTIEGVSWRLIGISKLEPTTFDQSPRAIARFENGRLRGFSGCNRFTGSYALVGDRLDIGNQTHTVNKCSDAATDVEQLLKFAFKMPVHYAITDGDLELVSDAGISMVFEAEPARALEGVEWVVVELNDGNNTFVEPGAGTTMSLSFRGDGALVGNSGCNLFKAAYTRDGERLSIGNAAATHRACKEMNVMERERALTDALMATRSWAHRGELLDLLLTDGQRALTAERAVLSVEK